MKIKVEKVLKRMLEPLGMINSDREASMEAKGRLEKKPRLGFEGMEW